MPVKIIGPEIGPKPEWAKAVIVAEYETDQSDCMTDYFATSHSAPVLLAWSRHERDVFSEMRKAAATFKPTAELGPGCDVWTVRVVLSIPEPGYFADHGRMVRDGDDDHDPDRPVRTFTTEEEAQAFIAAQPALGGCWYGEHLVGYRWQISRRSIEHREKYSMGAGYYLKGSGRYSSGWRVSKWSLSYYGDKLPESNRVALEA